MSLPIMTDKEDIDSIVNFLRTKPVGITVEAAKALVEAKLLDGRKLNAYRTWGFVADNGDKITLTEMGRNYSVASEEKKKQFFAEVIRQENIYVLTLEWISNSNLDQLTAADAASHWFRHFRQEIGTETEQSLVNQVTCFMGIATAAGFGEYKIGRRGQPTRFEANISVIRKFITGLHEESSTSQKPETTAVETMVEPLQATNHVSHDPKEPVGESNGKSQRPSLHIDIQIHIDPDSSPEQIDKIFESMAKHLYNSGD